MQKPSTHNTDPSNSSLARLYLAANIDELATVQKLIKEKVDVNALFNNNQTALHIATGRGHTGIVNALIAANADVALFCGGGYTALHYAAEFGHAKAGEALINAGANIHARSIKGNTPLAIACFFGKEETIEVLLTKGADVHFVSTEAENKDKTLIEIVASPKNKNLSEAQKIKIIETLFKYGAKIPSDNQGISDSIKEKFTELSQPKKIQERDEALLKNEELIEAYKKSILNGNLTLDSAKTLIRYNKIFGDVILKAIKSITKEELKEIKETDPEKFKKIQQSGFGELRLGESGASPVTERRGMTPAESINKVKEWLKSLTPSATTNTNARFEGSLSESSAKKAKSSTEELNKNLLSATKNGEIEQVNALISLGANINAVDEKGDSALHLAVRAGNFTIVTSLLLAKANINTPNKNGNTPLCIASSVEVIDSYDRITILQDLINNGAEVNKANPKDGMSPLQIAAENGQTSFVELLLKNGAEIGEVNKKNGKTALSYAIGKGHEQVINILLNQADPDGYKPIHLAIISNPFKKEIFEFLLTKVNVDEPTENEEKKTPLHIAICHKNLEAVKCLLAIKTSFNTRDEKKDLNIPDENGNTPLHLATFHCLESVVKDLLDAGAKVDIRNNDRETAFDIAEKQNIGKIMKVFESQTNITSETEKQSQPKAPQAVSNKTPPLSIPPGDDLRIASILGLRGTLNRGLEGVGSSIENQVNAGGDIGGASARSNNKAPASHDKSEAMQEGAVETAVAALTMIAGKEKTKNAIESLLMLSRTSPSALAGDKEQNEGSSTPSSTLTGKRKGKEQGGGSLKKNKGDGGKGK